MTEQPSFEVSNPDTGKTYRIFASGRIEGFEDASCVVNRIPAQIARALADQLARASA